jgi:hypothetical protein
MELKCKECGRYPSDNTGSSKTVRYGKYRDSRFWAIWINDQLLAVTVYRKGALAILAYLGLASSAKEEKRPRVVTKWDIIKKNGGL